MSLYLELRPVASELLAEFRQGIVTLAQPGALDEDESQPWAPVYGDPITTPLNATVRGVPAKYVDGSLVVSSDVLVTAAVVEGVAVKLSHKLIINGAEHQIVKDVSVPPSGDAVVWKFIARA